MAAGRAETTMINQSRRPGANRPRTDREFVTDTLRRLDLALDRAEREISRLRRAATDARRAAAKAERALHADRRVTPEFEEAPSQDQPMSERRLRSVSSS